MFLNAWSSAGKEMTLLGLPVVTYCPTALQYPAELNYVGTTHAEYFDAIGRALGDGWSFERVRLAYRWCVLEYLRGLADLGDAVHLTEDVPSGLIARARRFALSQPAIAQRFDLLRRPDELAEQRRLAELIASGAATLLDIPPKSRTVASEEEETELLRVQLSRLVGGQESRLASRSRIVSDR